VLVPVSASDVSGNPVRNLTVADIVIEEEGRAQSIVSLGEPGTAPVDLALLFDISLSVQAKFAFEQEAAVRFIKNVLKQTDSISIFSIGIVPRMLKPRTNSADQAVRGIMSLAPSTEPTAFFDSVVKAATHLGTDGDPSSRRVLVVISDGEENHSKHNKLNDALRELQKNDCLFYAINPSTSAIALNKISLRGQSNLEAMSTETGGKTFLPEKLDDLEGVFRQIAEELQAQYLFGYYSTDERADGGFRRITVRAPKRSDLRVRARQGYYAPKS
jgi:Ca-activated chloride channel family protein